jgi:hypothetical protein
MVPPAVGTRWLVTPPCWPSGVAAIGSGSSSPLGGYSIDIRLVSDSKETVVGNAETGQVTGTKDKDHDILWYTETSSGTPRRV